MGTEISLKVSGATLDWSKNSLGIDHGALFQSTDHIMIPQHERYGLEENAEIDEERRLQWTVLRKPLSDVAERVELLGFSLNAIRAEYENLVKHETNQRNEMIEAFPDNWEPLEKLFTFDEFLNLLKSYNLSELDDKRLDFDYTNKTEKDNFILKLFPSDILKRIPLYDPYSDFYWSEKTAFFSVINILHPYSMIRLLNENKHNLSEHVEWDYGEIVANGWVHIHEIKTEIGREDSFLIATEGSSDSHILQKAFKLIKPSVSDFFRFIDVKSGHPFPGTGGLSKFAEGLVKIDIQNQIIFVLDNDSEGVEAFNKIINMKLPHNMSCMCLPDLNEFESFPTCGPDGQTLSNINRTAAAIECYLDLNYSHYESYFVRWTNYKKETGLYQGALEYKEHYAKKFLNTSEVKLIETKYDTSKLEALLNAIIDACSKLSGAIRIEKIKSHYPNLWTEEKV
ncbi:HEPN/Toprim-associated domain-containing protein [Kosakonia cowanii]|uniref:HEPN/Toprim-associated domain-containing protein n=1 Tax=Kosakonia cowanii TaxID=208223 RepID=UPI0023F788A8|nr:HEPN/Toprim-associated domain-containing protein [Kosakonia cowanii]MDF7760792.1 HEPN/Toprim-associated domain-containing protein [Kosakonia cowanii]